MTKLTAASVEKLRPGKTVREIQDGGCKGLRLVVQVSGSKSWCVRYRRPRDKKNAKATLGPVSLIDTGLPPAIGAPLSLAQARRLCSEFLHQLALGRDIYHEHMIDKRTKANGLGSDFVTAVADYVASRRDSGNRTWQAAGKVLGIIVGDKSTTIIPGSVAGLWRDRGIDDITADDIYLMVERSRTKGIPGRGTRHEKPSDSRGHEMHAALSGMFTWLLRKRRIRTNPCLGVDRPVAPPSRDHVLKDDEIKSVWLACEVSGLFGKIVQLLLLTGCRRREVSSMAWSELSEDLSTWTIPGSRTKNGRAHVVPLPPLAQEIIASVPRLGDCDHVFTTDGCKPVSGFSKAKRKLDAMTEKVRPWRLHDLRRTSATMMAESIRIEPHVIEALLNHVSGHKAGIAGVYNRAIYMDERRAALTWWADCIGAIVAGRESNVLALPRRA
jgi:integrase